MAQKSLQDRLTNDDIADLLEQLGKLIDRTKILYEQYFMGLQRLAPSQLHKDIERRIRDLTREHIRNTSLRYRLTTLKQKYGSYNTYWRRILREIEQGKYIRDVARAGRRAARKGEDLPDELLKSMPKRMRERILKDRDMARARAKASGATAGATRTKPKGSTPGNVHRIDDSLMEGGDLDLDAMFAAITTEGPGTLDTGEKSAAAKPAARPTPKPPPPRPAASASKPARGPIPVAAKPPPGMSEQDAKKLFQQYVKAKKLVGDRTDKLTYNRLMKSLNKQAPGIMTKHKAKGVDFGVVVKDDRVVLKARPKKK